MNRNPERFVYGLTIGCSSVLLFAVQPILAKALLPGFGGSAGVWVACMLFFQVVLLLGYLYSYAVTRHLTRKAQSLVHAGLLILSLWMLPLKPRLEPALGGTEPVLAILLVLLTSVGLPYFVLSTTSPLLQSWFATRYTVAVPYRLFALSNAASLAALLAYPVAIEPLLPVSLQLRSWSVAYAALVVFAGMAVFLHAIRDGAQETEDGARFVHRPFLWIALSACSSTLWLAVANHLSQEVAAVPFLWVLPLSLYLLSFILCFGRSSWYRPPWFRWLLPVAWIAASYRIAGWGSTGGLAWEIPVFSAALLVCCMFCHGELARSKPQAQSGLTFFYLMITLGGALGAVFVGLIAPNAFSTFLELPIGIAACVLLALPLLYGLTAPRRLVRLGVVAAAAFVLAARFRAGAGDVAHLRNFYGALQVTDAGAGETAFRSLYNGRTLHGVEFLAPSRTRLAKAYYGPESGAGRVLQNRGGSARRVGVVGLGVGTLAAYGRRGDSFRFYEINPAVKEVASRYFHFLGNSEARTEVAVGDGRLLLEREPPHSIDVLVLDAFSDDSIPVHLLTREAFEIYFRLLRDDGVLALHLTNRYVELAPMVAALAGSLQAQVVEVHNAADPEQQILAADWTVVAGRAEILRSLGLTGNPPLRSSRLRLWTDDYSNLFQVLK